MTRSRRSGRLFHLGKPATVWLDFYLGCGWMPYLELIEKYNPIGYTFNHSLEYTLKYLD